MPEKQPTLLLTQTVDGTWTVSVVANLSQGTKRAANMAKEATILQCVAVPVVLAALAPKMKDLLAGHVDIDAMMEKVETAEETVSAPGECQRCGVPHSPEGLIKCSSCLQYICPGCNSNKGVDCELCKDCSESLESAEADLAADIQAEDNADA